MARAKEFRVLVASDGSLSATAATVTAKCFPWPVGLRDAGWRVDVAVPRAAPLESLLSAVTQAGADLVIVGATGASGIRRLLLGSVAQGALDRSPVPVLIVR